MNTNHQKPTVLIVDEFGSNKNFSEIAEALRASNADVVVVDKADMEMLRARVEVSEAKEQLKAGSVFEMMIMPAGTHTCNFGKAAGGKTSVAKRTVEVDAHAARNLQEQLKAINTGGKQRAYFDFDHQGSGPAAGWPSEFYWKADGVYCKTELSKAGAEAISGKTYRAFSPQFWVTKTQPAKVITGDDACMGSFVNEPAFHEIEPLWAKDNKFPGAGASGAAGAQSSAENQNENTMNKEQLEALQSKISNLAQEIEQLKGKAAGSDELAQARLATKQAEHRAAQAELQNEQLKAKAAERSKADAKAAVDAAVKRGAIAPQNEQLKAKWLKACEENPDSIEMLNAMEGKVEQLGGRQTEATAVTREQLQAKEGPKRIILALSEQLKANRNNRGFDAIAHQQRGEVARKIAYIYAKDVAKNSEVMGMPLWAMQECLTAAADADTLGTLSGTLVMQRTLEFFRINYPMFKAIYTDFSDQPALLNQTIDTRVVSKPAVQTYSTVLGADGRPGGWSTASAATTTSKTITIDEHVGVPIVFDANVMASTVRRLFDEQAPAMAYALASYFVAKVYGKFTAANYNAYAAISGAKVPVAYVTYAKGALDFARSAFVDLNAIFNPNEVPLHDRAVLINSQYYAAASKDPSLVTFWAPQRNPELITEGELPKMSKFVPIEAPDFPASNNRVGFAFQKTAVGAVSRIPQDYSKVLPGASYGNVSMISDPETGMAVMLVEYVNHTGGFAEMRMETMIGAGVMDSRAGLVITSQ